MSMMSAMPATPSMQAGEIATLASVCVVVLLVFGAVRQMVARRAVRNRGTPIPLGRPPGTAVADRLVALWRQRRTRHRPRAADLAVLLDDIARRCASGHSTSTAFLAAVATHPETGEIHSIGAAVERLRVGSGLEEALGSPRDDDADVALAVHVLRMCARQGGNVTESLDRAAVTLRERQAMHEERLAQSGQARLSAKVLTVLPIAFASWTMLTTASVQRFMISPAGMVCLALGVGLNTLGWTLMQRAITGGR